ncbi:MAG: lysophospholipid acyltransferase family protein [Thermoguttaceae bacterium]|nr:lysophospholipid acyltransferase family protein [Thermoguttaceae bacterium]
MKRSLFRRFWYVGTRRFFLMLMQYRYGVRFHYSGLENLDGTEAMLLAANHESFMDPPAIGAGIPEMINYLARESLFRNPLFGAHLRAINVIPLDLDSSSGAVIGMKESIKRLNAGEKLLVFPEGTRTEDGEIHEFKPGFVILAKRAKCPILPIAIAGAYERLPKGTKNIRSGDVYVRLGQPVSAEDVQQLKREEVAQEVRRRVTELQMEMRREFSIKQSS